MDMNLVLSLHHINADSIEGRVWKAEDGKVSVTLIAENGQTVNLFFDRAGDLADIASVLMDAADAARTAPKIDEGQFLVIERSRAAA